MSLRILALALLLCMACHVECGPSRKLAASASSTASASGGNSVAVADCSASNDNSADCAANAKSDGHNKAVSIAKGVADTGDVKVQSVAQALGSGNKEAIAVAVGKAVKDAGGPDKAAPGLSVVFAKSVNDGAGKALAVAISDGVAKGGDVKTAIVTAIAKIVKEKGCDVVKPTLAQAFAFSRDAKTVQGFADAFDFDFQVAKCAFPVCSDDRWHCCKSPDDSSKCSSYSTFKSSPNHYLSCDSCGEELCICPKSF